MKDGKEYRKGDYPAGTQLECVDEGAGTHFTKGKVYAIDANECLVSDRGGPVTGRTLSKFIVASRTAPAGIQDGKPFIKDDYPAGTELECVKGGGSFTIGRRYSVDSDGRLVGDDGNQFIRTGSRFIVHSVGNHHSRHAQAAVAVPHHDDSDDAELFGSRVIHHGRVIADDTIGDHIDKSKPVRDW